MVYTKPSSYRVVSCVEFPNFERKYGETRYQEKLHFRHVGLVTVDGQRFLPLMRGSCDVCIFRGFSVIIVSIRTMDPKASGTQ